MKTKQLFEPLVQFRILASLITVANKTTSLNVAQGDANYTAFQHCYGITLERDPARCYRAFGLREFVWLRFFAGYETAIKATMRKVDGQITINLAWMSVQPIGTWKPKEQHPMLPLALEDTPVAPEPLALQKQNRRKPGSDPTTKALKRTAKILKTKAD